MKLKLLFSAGMYLASAAVFGAIGNDLRDLPGNVAADEDKEMMRGALLNALENQPDNVTTGWKNPATGSSGIIRTVETYEKDAMHCRKLRLRNSVQNETNEWMFSFCKTPEGVWKIAP